MVQETGNNYIDFTKSEQYTLSIRLSADGFSFSIYNPISDGTLSFFDKEIVSSLSVTANLKRLFRETDFLSLSYKRVNVVVADRRFVHTPFEWFEDELAETVFYHSHSRRENEVVLYNILQRSNVAILFGMDKSAHLFLKEKYPEAGVYSYSTPLSEHFSAKSRLGNSKKMYVSLSRTEMAVFCYERGHLLLANSYACEQTADRIYYLLYLWKQTGFDQERDELHLTGALADKEALVVELRKYILQVFIMNPETNMDINALLTCE